MRSARYRPLFASTSVRVALLNAALVALALIGAAAGAWIATRDLAEIDLRDRVEVETAAIASEAREEGLAAAADAVRSRAERPGALEYGMLDAAGRRVAGDLPMARLPLGWTRIGNPAPEPDGDIRGAMLIETLILPGGALLSVGGDLSRSEAIRDAIFRSMAAWGVAAILLGLAAALWLTTRALHRMDVIGETLSAVSGGDLSARAPLSPAGDDIDALAGGVNAMLDRIALLVAALRRVSADVAHELRTPLTHVRQRLDRAATATDDDVRRAELTAADVGMEQALRMFDAMLRLAEIDAGHARSRFTAVDLGEIAERVADAYRPEVETSGRSLQVSAPAGMLVTGDADLVTQALANIVENSLKHGVGGTAIKIVLTRTGDRAALAVRDEGTGIDASARSLVVKPFHRIAGVQPVPGSGLGLAVVAAIARLHGADLQLTSAEPGLVVAMIFPAGRLADAPG